MHKNTFLLVVVLAVFAALVVGVNIGRNVGQKTSPTSSPTPLTAQVPTQEGTQFISSRCGVSLSYPPTLTLMNSASGSALFVDKSNADESVVITCQKEIPRPALPLDKIEVRNIQGNSQETTVSAKLYHDTTPSDGSPVDELIFTHPKTDMDVFIAGYGKSFNAIIGTLKLLP